MSEPEDREAFATFRPRRGRRTAIITATTSVVVFAVVALVLPGPAEAGNWRVPDRVFFLGIGVALAAGLWRFASLRAVPTRRHPGAQLFLCGAHRPGGLRELRAETSRLPDLKLVDASLLRDGKHGDRRPNWG